MGLSSSILSEMEKIRRSQKKMEYKSRRLFEQSQGNPPQETIAEYNRIMEVNTKNLQEFKKQFERFYPVVV